MAEIPVDPSFIPPEPILPAGDTNLPDTSNLDRYIYTGPKTVTNLQEGPDNRWLEQIRLLPQEHQELILKWWPHCFGRPSPYLHRNAPVMNLQHIVMHAEGYEKKHGKRKVQALLEPRVDNAYGAACLEWQKECAARKAWIEGLSQKWKARIQERKIAVAQWDGYVAEAKRELDAAKLTIAPPMPSKDRSAILIHQGNPG